MQDGRYSGCPGMVALKTPSEELLIANSIVFMRKYVLLGYTMRYLVGSRAREIPLAGNDGILVGLVSPDPYIRCLRTKLQF